METVCFENLPQLIGTAFAGVVTAASVLSNFVKADTALGKVVHFLAINLKAGKGK